MARCPHSLRITVALGLVMALIVSPPLAMSEKYSKGYPTAGGGQIGRCNPCPFNSLNRPIYDIDIAAGGFLMAFGGSTAYFSQEVLQGSSDFLRQATGGSPLRC
jgi:hypothetical protein